MPGEYIIMSIKPFVKWAGGKGKLIDSLMNELPNDLVDDKINTYIEPFLGGGALFFTIAQNYKVSKFLLNDCNTSLICTYKVIKENPNQLIKNLTLIKNNYDDLDEIGKKKYYYEVRDDYNQIQNPTIKKDIIKKSALLLFLNKTCFNGLFRLNQKGCFNVPFGKMGDVNFFNSDNIIKISKLLQNAEFRSLDFKEFLSNIDVEFEKSFFYMDPPYTIKHGNNGFLGYNEKIFSWDDQISLAKISNSLAQKGAKVMVSNAKNKDVEELYSNYNFYHSGVTRMSLIGGKKAAREMVSESIFTSYEKWEKIGG